MQGPWKTYRASPVCAGSGGCLRCCSAASRTPWAQCLETPPQRRTARWSQAAWGAPVCLPGRGSRQAIQRQDATVTRGSHWYGPGLGGSSAAVGQAACQTLNSELPGDLHQQPVRVSTWAQTLPWVTCAHVHTVHTHTHTRTHCKHMYILYMSTHTCMCTCTHQYTHTHTLHARTDAHTYKLQHIVYAHMCTHTQYTHVHMHTHVNAEAVFRDTQLSSHTKM